MRFIFLISLGLILSNKGFAQNIEKPLNERELGISLGTAYYLGDINPYFPLIGARESAGVFFRFNRNYRWSFKTNLIYGRITANDANNFDANLRTRNLTFRSIIVEFSEQIEFNFLPHRIDDNERFKFSPYSFIGIGAFYYNPQARVNGTTYNLRDYNTEGQGVIAGKNIYGPINISIPMGMGVKYNLGPKSVFTLEFSIRKTFTDYLDDVSGTYVSPSILQANNGSNAVILADPSGNAINKTGTLRGNPDSRDWYGFLNIGLSFKLPKKGPVCEQYR